MKYQGTAAERDALLLMSPGDEFHVATGPGAGTTSMYTGAGVGWVQTHSASGAAHVSDTANPSGIGLQFWLDVVAATLPTEATSGCIRHANGFRNPKISSVMVSAGAIPPTTINTTVRWCFAESDAAAAVLLPTTFPVGLPSVQAFDSGSFSLVPVITRGAALVGVNIGIVADVDAAIAAATNLVLLGYSARGGAVATEFVLKHGATGAGGTLLAPAALLAINESRTVWLGDGGVAAATGVSIDWVSGTLEIELYYRIDNVMLVLPSDLEIQTSSSVTRLYMAHNITGVTLIFGIGAVEKVA